MGSKYSILLEGVVDEKSLRLSLDKIKKKIASSGGNLLKLEHFIDSKDVEKVTAVWQQGTKKITENVKLTEKGLVSSRKETEKLGASTNSWVKGMSSAVKTAAQYALGIGLIYKIVGQIGEGFEYILSLNKELTNIQIVSGMSNEQVKGLGKEYNSLAKEMGATTLEVARGSLEYIRQGKTAEETGELLRSTLVMSKLGNLDTAQATEYLTSIMNAYKLEASEMPAIIDKIIQLDNTFATSTGEVAEALQRSAISGQQAGVEFEELASMIATISQVTRREAGVIGTSLRTMLARFQDIKKGALDEDGLGINAVDDALKEVGITITDDAGKFRDFTDVLDELYPIWQKLDPRDPKGAAIVKAMAGVRQRENLLVLLENEQLYRKGIAEQMNAEGLALERYEIYLDNAEAAQNRMKASWEGMWQSTLESDALVALYNFIAGTLELIDNLGGIVGALETVTMVMNPFLILTYKMRDAIFSYNKQLRKNKELMEDGGAQADSSGDEYDEYKESILDLAEATGYQIDEEGKLYRMVGKGASGMREYADGVELLTEAQYKARDATDGWTAGLDLARGAIDGFITATLNAKELIDLESESVDILTLEYRDLINALGELNPALDSIDFKKAFGGDTEGAQSFFVGLATEAIDTLGTINEQFESGSISLTDYTTYLLNMTETFTYLGDTANNYADALGISSEQASIMQAAVTNALYEIGLSQENLMATQELNATLQQVVTDQTLGNLQMTGAAYDELLWKIANDAAQSGQVFTDMTGNALVGAQAIYSYLAGSNANFNAFVEQAAIKTGNTVQQIAAMIGQMMGAISSAVPGMPSFSIPSMPSFTPSSYGGGSSYESQTRAQERAKKSSERAAERAKKREEAEKALQKAIEDTRDVALDSLKDQLKAYDRLIDARKKLLESMKEERSYQKELEESQSDVIKIQSELVEMQFDDSEEANARRLALEENLIQAQSDLEDLQYNRGIDLQMEALDAEYSRFESLIDEALRQVSGINANSVGNFLQQLTSILGNIGIPAFHTGIDKGEVGGLKNNEEFIKVLKGEVVITPEQMSKFTNTVLPKMMGSPIYNARESGVTFDKLIDITVEGNMDDSTMPSIEAIANRAVEKLNKAMMSRGFNRPANSFSV